MSMIDIIASLINNPNEDFLFLCILSLLTIFGASFWGVVLYFAFDEPDNSTLGFP